MNVLKKQVKINDKVHRETYSKANFDFYVNEKIILVF